MEALVASSLIGVLLLGALGVVTRDTSLSRDILKTSTVELMAQEMLYQIERELADAHGEEPNAELTSSLDGVGSGPITVDSTLTFPDEGMLILDRGTPSEERVRYSVSAADQVTFDELERGQQCTEASVHTGGSSTVMWAGLAEPLENQDNPAAGSFDGSMLVPGGQLFFRGDGTGFSYRVPVDPGGGKDFLDGDDVQWGAEVNSVATLDGRLALEYVPRTTYDEAEREVDLNGDGDVVDVFDVGQIRRRAWNAADPTLPGDDIGLGPTAIIQERCNWGGDLDGDGFDDPMLLWDKDERKLYINLFLLGEASSRPVVRPVRSMLFLRNEFEG
jgi:hypothetical protein